MSTSEELDATRARLFAIAYRILGTVGDAEDAVQETLLRWHGARQDHVRDRHAWMATVVARVAIDRLRLVQRERSTYTGQWLPEPIVDDPDVEPERRSERNADISVAFLRVLERLTPDERASFVLHDAFGYRHGEIAVILGRTTESVRQLVHRARARLHDERPRFPVDHVRAAELAERFIRALERGDERELRDVLAEDVIEVADGGADVRAGLNVVAGRERVVRLLTGLRKKHWAAHTFDRVRVGGLPGFLVRNPDRSVYAVCSLDLRDTSIAALHILVAPSKVARVTDRAGRGAPLPGSEQSEVVPVPNSSVGRAADC